MGTPFYSRKEVKDIVCYIRLLLNIKDMEAFKRIINTPKRGIGEATVDKIIKFAEEYDLDIATACKNVELKGKAKVGLKDLLETLGNIDLSKEPQEIVQDIIEQIDYANHIKENSKTSNETEDRMQNLNELMIIASGFDNVEEFVENMLVNDNHEDEEDGNNNAVQMMTMHSSKGLEFPAIIMIGANDGVCPHWKAETSKDIQEERRLFYVGMTRAEEYLFITRAIMTETRGRVQKERESRFINEIDEKFLAKYKPKK